MRRWQTVSLLIILLLRLPYASAQDLRQCTMPDGRIVLTNEPCPGEERKDAPPQPNPREKAPELPVRKLEGATLPSVLQTATGLNALYARFKDAVELASNTSRITLAGPVGNLQAIKQAVVAMSVQGCLVEPKNKMMQGISKIIDGFMTFMRYGTAGDLLMKAPMQEGVKLLKEYERDTQRCTKP